MSLPGMTVDLSRGRGFTITYSSVSFTVLTEIVENTFASFVLSFVDFKERMNTRS